MAVTGLPTVELEPVYSEWRTGGVSTGFVSSFPYDVASSAAYATANPPVLGSVTAECNGVPVNLRAKFYWAYDDLVNVPFAFRLHTKHAPTAVGVPLVPAIST
jgi:hypothetical protein